MYLNNADKTPGNPLTSGVKRSDLATVCILMTIMGLMALGRTSHYLLFHTMAELFAIVVSFSIFMFTWVGQRYLSNGYLVVLGAAYAAIGLVDVFHTLTFRGMNLFPGVSTNYPTQFWLIARFLEALALLCAPIVIDRKPNFNFVSVGFMLVALCASGAVTMQVFPATFIDGVGLTAFKVYGEYVIIVMLALALAMLLRQKQNFEPRIFVLLSLSLVLAIATEFCFTRYGSFYDFTNELGHYFRFLTVALAFIAIVASGIRQPMEFIFHELEQQRQSLDKLNAKLSVSEDRLNQAQSVAKVGSWYLDVPNNVHTWSEETYRMFGVPVGTPLAADTFANCIHPDDRTQVFSAWALALKGAPYDIEHRVLVNGTSRWVREVAKVTFAADGSPLIGIGTVQDITEIKHTQDLLRDSEAFNASIFDSIVESVAVLDVWGVIVAVNASWRSFAKDNGAHQLIDNSVGQNYLRICSEAVNTASDSEVQTTSRAVAEGIRAVLEGVQTHFELEYPCHSPTEKRWFHLYVSPLQGSRRGAIVSHLDITVRKVAQEKLLQREELYRRQFSDSSAVMLMIDPTDGQIIDANAAAVAYYGYSQSELLSMNITDINPISIEEAQATMNSVTPERGKHFEFLHRLADSSLRDVEAFSSQIILGERKILHVIVHDITERKLAQKALSESEERYHMLFDTSIDAILLTSPQGQIFSANRAACELLQHSEDEILAIGRNGVVDVSDPRLALSLEERRKTGKWKGECNFVRKDGTKFPCDVSSTMFIDSSGNPRTSIIFRDITERKRIEAALKESERRMSAVFQSSPIGIVISRLEDGKILEVNDACLRLYHYSRDDALGRTVADLSTYVDPQQRVNLVQTLRECGAVDGFLIDFRTHDGDVGVLEMSGRVIELKGEPCLLAMLADVSERERARALVQEHAFHDTLTNLPNRRLLGNRLRQAMVAAKRSGCYGAVMFIDLDNFKPLNDLYGHDIGDLLLIEAAARLLACVREMDTVARVGGDEFVIMLGELNPDLGESTKQSAAIAEKVRKALSDGYRLTVQRNGKQSEAFEHTCTASIGVALFVNDEVAQDDLLNRADVAMYQAKRSGRNMIRFYKVDAS